MKEMLEEYYPKEDIEDANLIPRPKFSWEKGTFTLWDVNNKIPLPAVVQCDTKSCPVPVDRTRFNFDLTQPLLLHRNRVIRKIPARSLYVDKRTQTYKEIGDPLLIPEDYKGWFSILKKNTKGTLEDTVPHFTKIEEIASSDTEEFLIGGDKCIQTFQILDRNNGNPIQQQRQMFPGDVLRKGKIYTGETKKKSRILRKGKTVSEKFLLCTDDSDREVLIPFTQIGKFYSLTITAGKLSRPVMQMSEIVADKLLPCVVKLVYGRVPNTPCSFTGLLHLDKDALEQSVIASTILNYRNVLLEIPILCNLRFRVAEIDREVISNKGYKNALSLCAEKAQIYMRNIKVCHSLEREPDPPSQCESTYTKKSLSEISDTEDDDVPLPSPHMTSASKNSSISSIGSSSTEKTVDRDSGYIKMDSPCRHSAEDEHILDQEFKDISDSDDEYCLMNESPYLFKIFLENKYMVVPMYDRRTNTHDKDENDTDKYGSTETIGHNTTPPLSPPPPLPCVGPPPTPCSGSPKQDSGVSDGSLSGKRRPSTVTFFEGSSAEVVYSAPKIPTRRVSAPPGYDTVPTPKPKIRTERRKRGDRRGSQITYYEGCESSLKESSRNIKRRMSETVVPEYARCLSASGSSTEVILESDDFDEDEFPIYENIAGLQEITDTMDRIRRDLFEDKGQENIEEELKNKTSCGNLYSESSLSTDSSSSGISSSSTKNNTMNEYCDENSNYYFADDKTKLNESVESFNDSKFVDGAKSHDTSFSSEEELQILVQKSSSDNAIFKRISYFADDEIDEAPEKEAKIDVNRDETSHKDEMSQNEDSHREIIQSGIYNESSTNQDILRVSDEQVMKEEDSNIKKSPVSCEVTPSCQIADVQGKARELRRSKDKTNSASTAKEDFNDQCIIDRTGPTLSPCVISNSTYDVKMSPGTDSENSEVVDEKSASKRDSDGQCEMDKTESTPSSCVITNPTYDVNMSPANILNPTEDVDEESTSKQDIYGQREMGKMETVPSPCLITNPTYHVTMSSETDQDSAKDVNKRMNNESVGLTNVADRQTAKKIPPKTMEKTYKKVQQKTAEFQSDKTHSKELECFQQAPSTRSRTDSHGSLKNRNECSSPKPKVQSHHHDTDDGNKFGILSEMSVSQLSDALRNIGLKQGTVDKIKENNIDGQSLSQYQENEESLKEFLPDVGHIEVQKISMFIKGWRNI